jgi:NTP pyrophosphatase (non-canonical NTP hydrolase)
MIKSLAEMAEEVREVNELNGWWPTDRTFGDAIALLHTEVSEAMEAFRRWGTDDVTEYNPATAVDDGNGGVIFTKKPEGVGSEFADILIRLLDMAKEHGIDLEAEYERKISHNRVRGWKHGGKKL